MTEPEPQKGVSLSPKSMVDSVADWPLHQVVEHLRKKEREDRAQGKESAQPSRIHCRSTVKSLIDVIDSVAAGFGVSRTRLCRWLSYHGMAIAREDTTITKLARAQAITRDACLADDDTDTLDIMNSLMPYAPKVMDDNSLHLFLYDAWVASDFDDMARICGVYRYRIIQIFLIKSILSGDVSKLGETVPRMVAEVVRWDTWMGFRLGALETLVDRKKK